MQQIRIVYFARSVIHNAFLYNDIDGCFYFQPYRACSQTRNYYLIKRALRESLMYMYMYVDGMYLSNEDFHLLQTKVYSYIYININIIDMHIDIGKIWGFPSGSAVRNPPAMQQLQFQSLGLEDPLEEGMVAHSNILAWRIPWTEDLGRLQSVGSQRIRHN